MRKSIELLAQVSRHQGKTEWRQYKFNIKQIKKQYRRAQQSKRNHSKEASQERKKQQVAHAAYLDLCKAYLQRVQRTRDTLIRQSTLSLFDIALLDEVETYVQHAIRQINQTDRRILNEEKIPHAEKVFSIFEPHTEWICKGKAGVPVELGLRLCVMEDQHQFILYHHVMAKQVDVALSVLMVKETKQRFPELISSSYDRGFYSKTNREELQAILTDVALPKRGRLSAKDKVIQAGDNFRRAKNKHSAIESAINALEVHGLDRCPDHGINGFKRYVGLAIAARNVQRIGTLILKREKRLLALRRIRERKKAA